MAALFDLDTEPVTAACAAHTDSAGKAAAVGGGWADWRSAFAVVTSQVGLLEPRDQVREIDRCLAQLNALKTNALARVHAAEGEHAAARLLENGKASKRTRDRAAKRASVAAKNPSVVDKIASGDLSEDHVDVIADTAAKTGGAAAVDNAFIDRVAAKTPDQAKAVADRFIEDHADPDGVQSHHDRQRANRSVSKFFNKRSGLSTLKVEGDDVAIDNMWQAIKKHANRLFESDGGRDLAASKHPRTRDQRLFDAVENLVSSGGAGAPRAGAPAVFVGTSVDKLAGLTPDQLATQIGLGLIPDSVLAEYIAQGDIIPVLYDHAGTPLWLGRKFRHAQQQQRWALIIRDRGCVLCGAHHTDCQAHHLLPWNAPDKGETNLNNLALLCTNCHHRLHQSKRTLYKDAEHTWRTRPATPNETPPTTSHPPERRKHPRLE